MRPFSKDSSCPKCGNDEYISVHYVEGMIYFPPNDCKHSGLPIYREHIHRTCECCGYQWAEAPLDAERNQEIQVL